MQLARADVLSTKPSLVELDGEHGRNGGARGGDQSSVTTAANYGVFYGVREREEGSKLTGQARTLARRKVSSCRG